MATPLLKDELHGVIPPAVSTFDVHEDLDLGRYRSEMRFMRASGVELAVVGGSTGEGSALTPEELAALVDAAVDEGLRVIAGVITTTSRDAIRRGRLAHDAGASALLAAPPIYVQPSETALESFLVDLAEGATLPVVFYNHFFYSAAVLRRVAALPEVIGVKEASVDVIAELAQAAGDQVSIAAGIDPAPIAGLAVGATSVIAGVNAVVPAHAIAVYEAFSNGHYDIARERLDRMAPLARLMVAPVDFPAAVKFAINAAGRDVGSPRLPYQPVNPGDAAAIRDALQLAGLPEPTPLAS